MEAPMRQWSEQLAGGLDVMGIALDAARQRRLLDYLALLLKWNRAFNLTAIRDPAGMVSRQLLDSLSILPLMRGARVLDVGTGPGLPGIPLAICLPDSHFTLLDSNGKKCRFVRQAIVELALDNAEAVQERVEGYRPARRFDTITSRAFAALPVMQRVTEHLLADGGCLLAMKGTLPLEEVTQVERAGFRVEARPLRVQGCYGERHALLLTR
ncbi:MAG: 16S rRNA (guanine(527)-N(7))-methyltransferase RsmG [gamma proteobacterium symbiont of Phacoides pectinatus]